MDTCISRVVRASPHKMFALAASVEDWPRLLAHYRFVRLLDGEPEGRQRTVEMAARRDIAGRFGFRLHWIAIQTTDADRMRIEFRHVKGVTAGMWVEWTIEGDQHACEARIRHVFNPNWPGVPDALIKAVIGDYFVNGVARRTLALLARWAERPS